MSTFIDVPANRIEAELDSIGSAMKQKGSVVMWTRVFKERVFVFTSPSKRFLVKVYTSVSTSGDTRFRGTDCIRIVCGTLSVPGDLETFKPTRKSKKIKRTAPRSGDRVGIFLERLRGEIRASYADLVKR